MHCSNANSGDSDQSAHPAAIVLKLGFVLWETRYKVYGFITYPLPLVRNPEN